TADSCTARGAALVALAGPRIYFQSPRRAAGEGPGGTDAEGPGRRQGKVTVQYDLKELRKRLNLEKWILEQLTRLYDCQEEEIPELEIDVDELLDMESDDARAAFTSGLPDKIRGMQKRSEGPQPRRTVAPTGQSLPPDLVATAIPGDPAARPGAMSRAPRAPGPGVSSPAPSVFHFWGFFYCYETDGTFCVFILTLQSGPVNKARRCLWCKKKRKKEISAGRGGSSL
uniref:Protein phosphatase 1 regulatory subunit 14 n=1 Tax=Rhinopithecus bieti TaxID=61621 RepID=A0A2K6KB10_RHIBE